MSWGEIKKINSDMTKTLDALINEKSADLAGMVSLLWPWDRKSLAGTTDITYSSNTTLTSRIIYGDVITINSGVTVTTMTGGVVFICNEFINNGTLTASGKGAAGGAAVVSPGTNTAGNPGANASTFNSVYIFGAAGGSAAGVSGPAPGGRGGIAHAGQADAPGIGAAKSGPDDYFDSRLFLNFVDWLLTGTEFLPGSGGGSGAANSGTSGAGGAGGGYVIILAATVTNNGAIYACGIDGGNVVAGGGAANSGGSGGGGGFILIECGEIVAIGTISAAGGALGLGQTAAYNGKEGGDGLVITIERMAA